MRRVLFICIAMCALMLSAGAQDTPLCQLPGSLDQLKATAAKTSDITLDSNMLKLAGNSINKGDPNEAEVQKMLSSIKSICVRSYKFDKGVQYAEKDVDALRLQFSDSSWSSVVKVRSKQDGENVDVFFKADKGTLAGIAILAVKPEEFTFVRIDGTIDLSQLAKLGGKFGIPQLNVPNQAKSSPKTEFK